MKSVSIVGGFLDGLQLELADGLNCLIGARGTGKTTALELIRYALDSLPTGKKERRRIQSLLNHNLGCRVEVAIETKDGIPYTVSRTSDEKPIVLTATGEPTDISLGASELFGLDIYSQNEIERIADDPEAQRSLIDNFERGKMTRIQSNIESTVAGLQENASRIAPLMRRLAQLSEDLQQLPALEQKLQNFQAQVGDDSGAVNTAHADKALRDRERRAIEQMSSALGGILRRVEQVKGDVLRQTASLFPNKLFDGPNGKAISAITGRLAVCGRQVDDLLSKAALQLRAAREDVSGRGVALAKEHSRQEMAFRELIEKHQKAQEQAAERLRVEREQSRLLDKERLHEEGNERLCELQKERANLLQRLHELRAERFALRCSVVERISENLSPTVRVRIAQEDKRTEYRRLVQDGFKNAGIGYPTIARKIAHAISPHDLAAIVRRGDVTALMGGADLKPNHAKTVIASLQQHADMLFELDTLDLPDVPQIELKDGNNYKASNALSTGQKCTAILPILLLDSENPLLIDQPEDNLDNGFVYETLVPIIRHVKAQRQLVFVTHNPNIPVLGDAERVFVFGSDGTSAFKVCEGSVDDCRNHIITLLEGGEDAFRQRQERYRY